MSIARRRGALQAASTEPRSFERGKTRPFLRRLGWNLHLCLMSHIESIRQWRALPPERKMQLRWDAIPLNVVRSMAFEGERVSLETIREIHARTAPPATLRPRAASSATKS
jgi:hypothetical protein